MFFHVETCNTSRFVCLHLYICLCASIFCYSSCVVNACMSALLSMCWNVHVPTSSIKNKKPSLTALFICYWDHHVDLSLGLPSLRVFCCHSFTTCSHQDLFLYICPFCYNLINLLVHFLSPLSLSPPSNSETFVAPEMYTVCHMFIWVYSLIAAS